MIQLDTIQKRHNLNVVFVLGEKNPKNNGFHNYVIARKSEGIGTKLDVLGRINFQNGGRTTPDAITGVLDTDLLEIVRHRLTGFQSSPYATRENAIALTHIEEALLWMNKRVEDRASKNILGTDIVSVDLKEENNETIVFIP